MRNKFDSACIYVYLKAMTLCTNVKKDIREMIYNEDGDIVQTVLLAMVAIVAAAALLVVLRNFINTQGGNIGGKAETEIYGGTG